MRNTRPSAEDTSTAVERLRSGPPGDYACLAVADWLERDAAQAAAEGVEAARQQGTKTMRVRR